LLLRQNQELSTQNKKLSTQIQQQFSHISTLEQERNKLQEELLILEQKHQLTKDELDCLRRQIFGRKSERFIGMDPAQLTLELEGMVEAMRKEETEQVSYTRKKSGKKERQGHSRMPIPAHLRREEITIEPENVPEGSKKIGEEVTEVMEYKKAEIYVKKYIRPKYVLPKEEGVVIGLLPSLPIPKGNAGPSLLSHVLIGKYIDHLPLYRQQKQFKRLGVEISDKTICGWVAASCELLAPLYEKLMQSVQQSGYLQADETPIKVLDKNKKGDTHKGYYWVYHSPITKAVCFQYRKGRGREGPKEFLKDFQGAIQADGWHVYDRFEKRDGITLLGCLAHVRRKFAEAQDNDKARAAHVLSEIQKLYATERKARNEGLDYHGREELRNKASKPVLKGLKAWLLENAPESNSKVVPKSKIGKAISYALGMWGRIERYLEDGKYQIDNNWVENSIRPVALGRKNYLFAGSHDAAQRAAMIYSLLATCKKNCLFHLKSIPGFQFKSIPLLIKKQYLKKKGVPLSSSNCWRPDLHISFFYFFISALVSLNLKDSPFMLMIYALWVSLSTNAEVRTGSPNNSLHRSKDKFVVIIVDFLPALNERCVKSISAPCLSKET
jgi:transposase